MSRPLRDVVHIEERTGPRGGGIWYLTLSCGHFSVVRMRAPSYSNNVGAAFGRLSMKDFFAPERSRCWICKDDPKPAGQVDAKAIIAACVARGVSINDREQDDIRFVSHEAYHGFDLDLEAWTSDSIHNRIRRLSHAGAATTEIEARAAEWIICEKLGISYEVEEWAFMSFVESINELRLKLPTNMADLIRAKRDDPKVKEIVERIIALGTIR